MNNRIYHNHTTLVARLADQAQEECYVRYTERLKTERADEVLFFDMFNARFAELLINECIRACAPEEGRKHIRQHFEVNK